MKLTRKILTGVFTLVIIFLLSIFLFKPHWLTIGIGTHIPVGTVVSWVFIVALSALFLLIIKRKSADRTRQFFGLILKINLLLAVFWGLLSYLLSGNWSFNFSGGIRFDIWFYFTAFIVVVPLIIFIIWVAVVLIRKIFSPK